MIPEPAGESLRVFLLEEGGMSWKRVTNMIKHDTNVVDMEKMKCNDNVLTQMKEGDILKKRR